MTRILAIVLAAFIPVSAVAENPTAQSDAVLITDAEGVELSDFLWLSRPIVVFADTPQDPRFIQQMELLLEDPGMLGDRDVVILTDTDPSAKTALRLKLRPRGFMMVLIGKDGVVSLRKPLPLTVREITRTIDKMPVRLREIQDRRNSG